MELRKLTVADREIITELFRDVFTNEPWNDDWSDGDQLYAYITDLTGQSYSLTFGYFDGDQLVALSMGYIRHWYSGTEYYVDELCVARHLQGKELAAGSSRLLKPGCRRTESGRSSSRQSTMSLPISST